VLVDAPCSGSGSWRRDPEGKWALTPERLQGLLAEQAAILDRAAAMVGPGGALAYATCSLLGAENRAQVDRFLSRAGGWVREVEQSFSPLDGGDGFYLCVLRRA
jgi:16S rRNA (cytosine967-C5)-methyltransferase